MSGETLGKRLIVSIHFNWGWKQEWEKVKKKKKLLYCMLFNMSYFCVICYDEA